MEHTHLIVCQVDRRGYRCGLSCCGQFHYAGDDLYRPHRDYATTAHERAWTETLVVAVDDTTGKLTRLPAALGLAALRGATEGVQAPDG